MQRGPNCLPLHRQHAYLNGAWGPPPELFSAYRQHRRYRMRLMCYHGHYQRHGRRGVRLPTWRMPCHPISPRRQPVGQQGELLFTATIDTIDATL